MERQMPHDLAAEEAVLGSLLVDTDSFLKIANVLTPHDFYREKNMCVFGACLAVDVIDQVTVAHELSKRGQLEAIGGAAYLSHLISNVATSVHIEHYASIVKTLSDARKLVRAGVEIAELGYEVSEDGKSKAMAKIVALARDHQVAVTPSDLGEFGLKYFDGLAHGDVLPVRFGLQTLDKIGGAMPGEYCILGGETSQGKTTLLKQFADFQSPRRVLYCITEMTRAQWLTREVAQKLRVPMGFLGSPRYIDLNMDAILGALEECKKSNVLIIPGSVTTRQIYYEAASLVGQPAGLSLIVVDYLQRVAGTGSDYKATSKASRELMDMAKELEIPLFLSSQLTRESMVDGKERQLLTRLKDSGNIENDADWVMFIVRKKGAKFGTPSFLYSQLVVAKHRMGGELPNTWLKFEPSEQKYRELVEGEKVE